jgi:hypothetical protein
MWKKSPALVAPRREPMIRETVTGSSSFEGTSTKFFAHNYSGFLAGQSDPLPATGSRKLSRPRGPSTT